VTFAAGRLSNVTAKLGDWAGPLGCFNRERFPPLPTDEEAVRAFTREELIFRTSDEPEVSILIPVYGKFATTWACLCSLANTNAGRSFEVILADDGSPDRTAEMLTHVRGIRIVRNANNLGYLRTNNHAARHARGKWLCLLNNDTRVTSGWLAELVDTFQAFPEAGLVGAKLLFPDGRLQEAGGVVFRDGGCANYGRWHDPSRSEYSFARPVDYCSAACALLPKQLWDELGGFDEYFAPAYYEDTDLAFRVREASRQVVYQPLARVVHYHGVTHGRDARRGLKRSLLTNRERFSKRWERVLATHPDPEAPARNAAEHLCGPGLLVLAEREPELDERGAFPREWAYLERAQRAGHRVSLWSRQPSDASSANRLKLQRRGVEVPHSPQIPSLSAYLRRSGERFSRVLVGEGVTDETLLATVRRHTPRANWLKGTAA
jgi:GT2 family glycosyltransferase